MELYKTKHAWILGGFEYLHADDVVANAGAGGATFRTDQLAGGQHVPFTKLMSGTADDAAVIPGDATNGLFVQVKTSALPSGAATAAKQPALGTAGSSSTDVISVQGIASGTALPVSVASIPSHAVTNAGTFATQVDGAALTSLQLIDDPVIADDSAFTPATSKVMMAGFEFDDSTPDSVDEGDAGAARMSANRNVYTQIRDAAGNERGVNVSAANALKVDASGAAVPVTDNSGSLTVDSPQLPAALGQTTMAASMSVALASNQSALPITDNSGSLTVDNAGTFVTQENGAALTSLQLIDDVVFAEDVAAVSGDKGIPFLAVRRDSASSGVSTDGDYANISVDSTGALRVTGGGGGTQYAEDTAHVSGDTGTLSLAVRRDANTTLVDTTGDYAPLQVDASGGLKVSIIAGAGSGGTASTDDAAFTVAAGSGTPAMGLFNDSTPDSVDEGDAGVLRMSGNRNLYTTLRDASGSERGANVTAANALKVDASGAAVPVTDNSGSLTVDNSGTFAVQNTIVGSTIPSATTMQSAVTANANGTSLNVNGFASAVLNVVSSVSMSGGTTINFEASVDDTTWVAINGHAVGSTTIATTTTADGDFRVATAGYKSVRARISAYSAGTITVKGYASPLAPAQTLVSLASGAATIGALTANQSVNVAQINGVTTLMGNGVTGTGSQRVTIASDNTAFTVNAAQSGTWTVQPGNTANTTAWKVDGSAVTQPVSLASVPSHAVTNAGTFAVQDSEKVADNAAFTDGTTKLMPAGFIFDETAGTALTENDIAAPRVDSKRAVVIAVEDATTRGQRQAVNAGGAAEVHGDAAHGASVAGNPVLIGLEGRSSDAVVTNGQAVRAMADMNGKQVVLPYTIPENLVDGVTAAITGTTDTAVIAAQGAGIRTYLTQIIVTNSHATVGTLVEIKDNTTVRYRGYAAPAGGGFSITLPAPLKGTANTAWNAANITTGSNTYVSASGYKAA
jgi:hypothetical protein